MEFERGRTRSHCVGNLLCKRLWTCCKTLCSRNTFFKQIMKHRIKLRWVYANTVLLHHFPALKMEGSGFSEISVTFYQTSKCHIPEDGILNLLLWKPQNLTVTGNFKTQIERGKVLWEVIYCSNGKLPDPCEHTLPLLNFTVKIQGKIQTNSEKYITYCAGVNIFSSLPCRPTSLNGSTKAALTVWTSFTLLASLCLKITHSLITCYT